LGEELQGIDEAPLVILDKIRDKIRKYFLFFSSSSSSSNGALAWEAVECLLNPANQGFYDYLKECRAFTLDQVSRGSGLPKHTCNYIIQKLTNAGLLIVVDFASGRTHPHNLYLFKGEDQRYAIEAMKRHDVEKAELPQLSLDAVLDKQWVEEYIVFLKKRYITEIGHQRIAIDFREQYGKYDKERVKPLIKIIQEAGIVVYG